MSDTEANPPAADPALPENAAAEAGADVAETVFDAMVGPQSTDADGHNIKAMLNVGLNVQIVLGQNRMPISQLLSLSRGSVIELDKKIGEPVDVMINDRLVARGDLVKVGENRIGVTLTEIVKDHISGRS